MCDHNWIYIANSMDTSSFTSNLPDLPHTEAAALLVTDLSANQPLDLTTSSPLDLSPSRLEPQDTPSTAHQHLDLSSSMDLPTLMDSTKADQPAEDYNSPSLDHLSKEELRYLLKLEYQHGLHAYSRVCRQITLMNLRMGELLQRHHQAKTQGRLAFTYSMEMRISTLEGVSVLLLLY